MIRLDGVSFDKQKDILKTFSEKNNKDQLDYIIDTDISSHYSKNEIIKSVSEDVFDKMIKSESMKDIKGNLRKYDYENYMTLAYVDNMENTILEIGVIPPTEIYPRPNKNVISITYRNMSSEFYDNFNDAKEQFSEYSNEFDLFLKNSKQLAFENQNDLNNDVREKMAKKFSMWYGYMEKLW